MKLLHRPPVGVRAMTAFVGLGVVLANTALLLSDRAPRLLRTVFGDSVRRITERLDADGRAGSALEARDIGDDAIVHFGLWAVATVVVGFAVWSWWGLFIAAMIVAATSLCIELAQGAYSSTRAVEAADAGFNLLGVVAGAAAVAVVYVLVDAAGRLMSPQP